MKRLVPYALAAAVIFYLAASACAGTGRSHPTPQPPLTPEQTAAVKTIVDQAIADYAAKHPTTAPAVTAAPSPQPLPAPPSTSPIAVAAIRGVWYQPANSPAPGATFADWRSIGINTLLGWERQNDASGVPTVSMAQWDQAARNAGLLRIREPGLLSADAKDATLIGFLQPDELDAAVITAGSKAEAVYLAAEQLYAVCKAAAPAKPVFMNFDGEQIRWHLADGQVDYARLLRSCDFATVDWHPVQRGEDVSIYATILDKFAAVAGKKLCMMLVEASNEELDPRYYKSRAPTVIEMKSEAGYGTARYLGLFYFTQRMTQWGDGFLYDNVTADAKAEMKSINASLAN